METIERVLDTAASICKAGIGLIIGSIMILWAFYMIVAVIKSLI